MVRRIRQFGWQTVSIVLSATLFTSAEAQVRPRMFAPEQREIAVRQPESLPHTRLPAIPRPPTVTDPQTQSPPRFLSLDEAIRTALANARAIRVLAGVSAVNSGRTIYDPAISNTSIDQEQARFDPRVFAENSFNRTDNPIASFDPLDPNRAVISGLQSDNYNLNAGVAKTVISGGDVSFNLNTGPSRFSPGVFPLNPQTRSSADVTFTQPLLQGAGAAANLAPIMIARIDTERSFFQFKDSVQDLVRGVVEAYWGIVFARTDVWARQKQFEQATEAFERAAAQQRVGISDAAAVSQTRVAMSNFRASLVAARASLLQREAALRNILGFPPYDPENIVPTTPPRLEKLDIDWDGLLELSEINRPDLIELKLILEADDQLLIQRRNQAQPRLDAVARYRWNGLEGEMPVGDFISSRPGQFTDWTMAVNFSVPLGLRQSRATLRRQELVIARDRANLEQGLHAAVHTLAISLRNLDQFFEQYGAFREAREAAYENLQLQWAEYRNARINFIIVLLAITDWGNAVSAEAQSIVQYNIELADLERQSGTILEAHGVRFIEERYGSIGPLGRWQYVCYPESLPPTFNEDRYPAGQKPAEEVFNLDDPFSRQPIQSTPTKSMPLQEELPNRPAPLDKSR